MSQEMRCFFTSDAQRMISLSICSLDEVSSTEGTPLKNLIKKQKNYRISLAIQAQASASARA